MIDRNASSGGKRAARRGVARRPGLVVLLLSTTALTGIAAAPALAADTTWDGSTDSNWFDGSNWDTNAVPTAADDVFINATIGSPVIDSGNDAIANEVAIGTFPTGGLLEISGAGSSLAAAGALVGVFRPGSMAFTLGSTGTIGYTYIGDSSQGSGLVTVDLDSSVDLELLYVGFEGTGTLSLASGGDVTSNFAYVGNKAGSEGVAQVDGLGSTWTTNFLSVGYSGQGDLEISDGGVVTAGDTVQIGVEATGVGTAAVAGTDSQLMAGVQVTVGQNGTGTLTIADGGLVSVGAGSGALNIAANAGSSGVVWIGAGFNETATGAGALDAATVQFGAGAGYMVFNHTETSYTFDTAISGLGTLYNYAGVTNLTGDASGFTGQTNVYGGSLYVNNLLGGLVVVNDEGTLGGSGTLGVLALGSGGTLAPGNSVGILNVASATFASGSTYEVELNDSGNIAGTNNDIVSATGVVTINGGTVHVTPENGVDDGSSYVPGTTYHIIHSSDSVVGTFDALADSYAFLDFVLNYDPSNVFLTSSVATSFCLSGMTANQCAVGDAVFSLGSGSVFDAVVNLSDVEAPGALDQLSGEIHASVASLLIEDSRFARETTSDRLRQAFKAPDAGPGTGSGIAAWGRAFGSLSRRDGDGNFAAMDRDIGGLFMGGDAALTDDVRLGLMGGYSRSNFSVDDRTSSGSADTWTLGAYGGGAWNAFSLKGGAAYSWHGVETDRSVAFTGFSDDLSADYSARTFQAYGEAALGFEAGPARFEPFAGIAYVDLSTDGFTENGGEAALTSADSAFSATFTTLGLRAEAAMVLGGADATLRGMLGWRHGFADAPDATLGFVSGGDAFTVAGVPPAEDVLVLGAGFDVNLTAGARLGLAYSGQFGAGHSDQGVKAHLSVNF